MNRRGEDRGQEQRLPERPDDERQERGREETEPGQDGERRGLAGALAFGWGNVAHGPIIRCLWRTACIASASALVFVVYVGRRDSCKGGRRLRGDPRPR